jgi:hypothetical protein
MVTETTPKTGYAFRHKGTGNVYLALYLGDWDSLDNYEEITEAEYEEIRKSTEADFAPLEEGE